MYIPLQILTSTSQKGLSTGHCESSSHSINGKFDGYHKFVIELVHNLLKTVYFFAKNVIPTNNLLTNVLQQVADFDANSTSVKIVKSFIVDISLLKNSFNWAYFFMVTYKINKSLH